MTLLGDLAAFANDVLTIIALLRLNSNSNFEHDTIRDLVGVVDRLRQHLESPPPPSAPLPQCHSSPLSPSSQPRSEDCGLAATEPGPTTAATDAIAPAEQEAVATALSPPPSSQAKPSAPLPSSPSSSHSQASSDGHGFVATQPRPTIHAAAALAFMEQGADPTVVLASTANPAATAAAVSVLARGKGRPLGGVKNRGKPRWRG